MRRGGRAAPGSHPGARRRRGAGTASGWRRRSPGRPPARRSVVRGGRRDRAHRGGASPPRTPRRRASATASRREIGTPHRGACALGLVGRPGETRRAFAHSISEISRSSSPRRLPAPALLGATRSRRRCLESMTAGIGRPRSTARRRSSARATEWNVPDGTGTASPRATSRDRSSCAALRVKVSASARSGVADPVATRHAIRRVSTRVLPEPAPATTTSGAASEVIAARWRSSHPSRMPSRVSGLTPGKVANRCPDGRFSRQ